jgi:hypothetical protein
LLGPLLAGVVVAIRDTTAVFAVALFSLGAAVVVEDPSRFPQTPLCALRR